MNRQRIDPYLSLQDLVPQASPEGLREVLNERDFRRKIAIERKRTERSKDPFLLMLLETGAHPSTGTAARYLDHIMSALLPVTRETDVIGWYRDHLTVGVMFTGLAFTDKGSILSTILHRVSAALREELTFDQFSQISISFHLFPDDWDNEHTDGHGNLALYPDLQQNGKGKTFVLKVKRATDVAGSAFLLTCCAPLFALIAVAIKLSSKGPVFFKQDRVGQYGKHFTFLKFRSMYMDSDSAVHREYVQRLIAGNAERIKTDHGSDAVYKLANDARITRIGKILRRSSLDELPQFINVLRGEMSLVGPRPPIPYELAAYETWHRRRLLQVKPGITGLWQVMGRSRMKFDEMVRLDLRYAESWSLSLDLKIIMRTPAAVVKGAY